MNRFFGKKPSTKESIIVVSGLPRSGTSMMVKMLAEGGLTVVIDEIRKADEDNPNGYFELEAVKQIPDGNHLWLVDAGGKVVKVISFLLEHLPSTYSYKVIFMERDIKEVLASQQKMLRHRNEPSQVDDVEIEAQFQKHLSVIKSWLARQSSMEVLYVSYNELIYNPAPFCEKIVKFLNASLDKNRMMAVPNDALYRNRKIIM